MLSPFTYDDAVTLAHEGFAGVTDKAEVPYVHHVLRVAEMVAAVGADEHTRIAAVLHDHPEDLYQGSMRPLRDRGVPEPSIVMIDGVTRRTGPNYPNGKEPYQRGLIARAAIHDGARLIKLMDNANNSLPRRKALLPDDGHAESMERGRYYPARRTLLAAEARRRAEGLTGRDFPTDPAAFLAWAIDLDAHLEAVTVR